MNVDGLDGIAAPQMDTVEGLAEADEVLKVAMDARPASPVPVESVGRACDRRESGKGAADDEVARRVAGVELELPRRLADLRLDESRVKMNTIGRRIDIGATRFQNRRSLRMEKVHADFLEDGEGSVMNCLQFVGRQQIDGFEAQPRLLALDGGIGRRAALGAPSPPRRLFAGLPCIAHSFPRWRVGTAIVICSNSRFFGVGRAKTYRGRGLTSHVNLALRHTKLLAGPSIRDEIVWLFGGP